MKTKKLGEGVLLLNVSDYDSAWNESLLEMKRKEREPANGINVIQYGYNSKQAQVNGRKSSAKRK